MDSLVSVPHSNSMADGLDYAETLKAGADMVVMVHPDYQYDLKLLPRIIQPIVEGKAQLVLGSRLKGGSALEEGMPWWKYLASRFFT